MSRLRSLVLVLSLALVAGGCAAVAEAAARVNGEKIAQATVEEEVDEARRDPRFDAAFRQEGESIFGLVRRNVLSRLILQTIKEQQAEDLNVEVSEEQVDQQIAQVREQYPSEQQFRDFLQQQGLTLERARALVRRSLLDQELQRAVTEGLEVEEAEIRRVYEENRAAFAEVHIKQIQVPSQEEAQRALEELNAGAPFDEVAERYSTSDQVDAGFIPVVQLGFAQAEIEGVAPGGFVGPLQNPGGQGFLILQVVERRTQPLDDELRAQITDQLLQGQRTQGYARWLQERVREADIVVNPKYGELDAEAVSQIAQSVLGQPGLSPTVISPATGLAP